MRSGGVAPASSALLVGTRKFNSCSLSRGHVSSYSGKRVSWGLSRSLLKMRVGTAVS
jgi:hypothetical protein